MKDIVKVAIIAAATSVAVFFGASLLVGDNQPEADSFGGGSRFPSGISADDTSPVSGEVRGTTLTITSGSLFGATSITATTDTLTSADFGTTIFLNAASGTTVTLPAATNGGFLRFALTTLFDTANIILDSAEGDNIEGTLNVAGVLVPCAGEDQINLVSSAETVGDFVELTSNGTSWFILGNTASSTGGMTCTDPS